MNEKQRYKKEWDKRKKEASNTLDHETLSDRERTEMWNAIRKQTHFSSSYARYWWSGVAALLVISFGLIGVLWNENSLSRYDEKVALHYHQSELQSVCLNIDGKEMLFDDNVEINSSSKEGILRVLRNNGDVFKIVLSGKERITVYVPEGKKASVFFADSSSIRLRDYSVLAFSVKQSVSEKVFLSGEGYLDITPNPERKFEVKTENFMISVLGTSFNVCAIPNGGEQSVTLVKGKVNVRARNGEERIMRPNQKYIYSDLSGDCQVLEIDNHDELIWKNEYLELHDESLSEVLKKINICYRTSYTYQADEEGDIRLTGKLDTRLPVERLMKIIQRLSGKEIEIEDNTVRIKY